MHRLIVLASAAVVMTGCASYEKFVRNDLKIPFVYQPPNDANHPYTFFMYTNDGNFQVVCDATRTTGMTNQEILATRVANRTATTGTSSAEALSLDVGLSRADLGAADAAYSRVNRVELQLQDGKVYTLPGVSISEVVSRIANTSCLEDARLYARENRGARFALATTIYGYDLDYRILTTDGVDVTAELPAHLRQVVLDKVGIGFESASNTTVRGDDLYVGFRGTSIDQTLAEALQPPPVYAIVSAPEPRQQGYLSAYVEDAEGAEAREGVDATLPAMSAPPAMSPAPAMPAESETSDPAPLQDRLIDLTDLVRDDDG